jgi:hypothetical protein
MEKPERVLIPRIRLSLFETVLAFLAAVGSGRHLAGRLAV